MDKIKPDNKELKINMVSHVHWDPMWYSSFQEYRIRLYNLVKKLMGILENNRDYKYFMFDGQVSTIEDYLEVAPEDEEKIRKFIKNGRLQIGPWFNQPEEFLISGESLVRNLKQGIESAEKLGGAMKVSYLCDPVGHIVQMPQIVKGFGIKYFSASRGLYDNDKIKSTEFIWEAPDGSEVLVHTMPQGYSNKLPMKQEDFNSEVERYKKELSPLNKTGNILYAQGCDHGEPMEEALELVKAYNKKAGREEITFTTLEQHMHLIEKFSDLLPHYRGEMRFSYNIFILSGILTTRMHIKLTNAEIQNGLEKWLEPFSSFNWLLSGEYPDAFINLAWKYQIKNSFHDCIYGAHADHVTPDIMNGYKQAQEIIQWKTNEALYNIAKQIGDTGSGFRMVIFNPTARERLNEVIDFEFFLIEKSLLKEVVVYDIAGQKLPSQVNRMEKTVKFSDKSGNVAGECFGVNGYKYSVSVLVKEIPALGFTTLFIKDEKAEKYVTDLSVGEIDCENRCIKVQINSNGTISVLDKIKGQTYNELHYFEDSGDRGDQYNYSSTVPAGIITSKMSQANITLEDNGPVKAVYKIELDLLLPEGLESDGICRNGHNVNNRITTYLTIRAYSRVIEFHTEVQNNSRDHRLTVAFPTSIIAQYEDLGSQFYTIRRDIKLPSAENWSEPPSPFRPHHRFVCIEDGKRNFTFMDRGLTEHKITEEGQVYITLLRCTSHLSKNTLPERMYKHAGPSMETPQGQEIGMHTYDYAVYLQQGSLEICKSQLKSEEFAAPVKGVFMGGDIENQKHSKLPGKMSFIKLEGAEGVIISAIKRGEEGNLIIRVFNSTCKTVNTKLIAYLPLKSACLVGLAEHFTGNLNFEGKELVLDIDAYKIITMSLKFDTNK